jgi:hypothetical protein
VTDARVARSQLAKVRAFVKALAGASEKDSHGSPGFFVKRKAFAYFCDNHHGDDRIALWCAAPEGAQAMLVDSDPDVYFVPPYVGRMGWVGVRLDRAAPWEQVAAVLEAAHGVRAAPKQRAKK